MKLQKEIDKESENKMELLRTEQELTDPLHKEAVQKRLAKSDEKVEALMMMMLHYCAGLQYCLDQEGEDKQRIKSDPLTVPVMDEMLLGESKGDSASASSESEKEASYSDVTIKADRGQHLIDQLELLGSFSDSQENEPEVKRTELHSADDRRVDLESVAVSFKNSDKTVMFSITGDEDPVTECGVLLTQTLTSDESFVGEEEVDDDEKDVTLRQIPVPMIYESSNVEDKII